MLWVMVAVPAVAGVDDLYVRREWQLWNSPGSCTLARWFQAAGGDEGGLPDEPATPDVRQVLGSFRLRIVVITRDYDRGDRLSRAGEISAVLEADHWPVGQVADAIIEELRVGGVEFDFDTGSRAGRRFRALGEAAARLVETLDRGYDLDIELTLWHGEKIGTVVSSSGPKDEFRVWHDRLDDCVAADGA